MSREYSIQISPPTTLSKCFKNGFWKNKELFTQLPAQTTNSFTRSSFSLIALEYILTSRPYLPQPITLQTILAFFGTTLDNTSLLQLLPCSAFWGKAEGSQTSLRTQVKISWEVAGALNMFRPSKTSTALLLLVFGFWDGTENWKVILEVKLN